MKNMFIAAIAVLGVAGISPAMAGDGEGTIGNSQFTQLSGVIAEAPMARAEVAEVAQDGAAAQAFVTQASYSVWLFPPHDGGGDNR